MNSRYRKTLGIVKSTGLEEREILSNYRKKLKTDVENIDNINEAVLELMKSIVHPRFGLKISEKIFIDIVKGSNLSSKKMTLFMRGFKSITHKLMFDILKNKYGKTVGSHFERNECEITVDPMKLPSDRSGIPCKFPPMKMKVASSVQYIKFEFFGSSGCIFVFFYLKKIIENFLKNLPEKIEKLYSSPNSKSSKENSSENESGTDQDSPKISSDSSLTLSPVFRTNRNRNLIKTSPGNKETKEPNVKEAPNVMEAETKTSRQETTINPLKVEIDTSSEEASNDETPKSKEAVSSEVNNETTMNVEEQEIIEVEKEIATEEVNVVSSKKEPIKKIEFQLLDCAVCALIRITQNINQLVEPTNLSFEIQCSCLCLRAKDTTGDFISKSVEMICKTDLVNVDSMPQLRENLQKIILNFIPEGASIFYCRLLRSLETMQPLERDRLVVFLREILDFCLESEFENCMYKDKQARRSLFQYLETTGSYFAFQSVVESLFKMFQHGVDVAKFLPEKLRYIIGLFQSAKHIEDFISYHDVIGEISRGIISDVYNRKFIDYIKLSRKFFKVDEERLEITFDNYLYIDKVNSRVFHFLDLGGEVYSEPIDFDNLVYVQNNKLISSRKWDFCVEDDENISENLLKEGKEESRKKEKKIDVREKPNACFESEKFYENDEGDDSIDEGSTDLQTVATTIVIKRDEVLEYFDTRKRKFVPGSCGADWPRMYNSPCCVVCGYNYIQLIGTQQRFGNFGQLKGVCKICKGLHVYKVKESPFVETVVGGDLQYTAVKDMEVKVTVTGHFNTNDEGYPDITNPVHDIKKPSGVHLKGEERKKLGKRAAEIGVKEAYMEQLGAADIDQLKAGNTSSVRSIPVIKMARKEKEQKETGGMNFYQSIMHVFETQQDDVSPNFEATSNSKKFPGLIRQVSKMKKHP